MAASNLSAQGVNGSFHSLPQAGIGRDLMASLFEMNHCQRPL